MYHKMFYAPEEVLFELLEALCPEGDHFSLSEADISHDEIEANEFQITVYLKGKYGFRVLKTYDREQEMWVYEYTDFADNSGNDDGSEEVFESLGVVDAVKETRTQMTGERVAQLS